jgi:hypothetical protein
VNATLDYTYANKSGTNVYLRFFLAPGVYEICHYPTRRQRRRFFAKTTDTGELIEITRDEVLECLKNAVSE